MHPIGGQAAGANAVQSNRVEWHKDGYRVSTDPAVLDRESIWSFLRSSYWAAGVPRAAIDHARFAWLGDVFVLEPHRGRGLGVWLVECVLDHPDLAGARVVLGTADAHGLYKRFGFRAVNAERMMERRGDRERTAAPERSASV